MQSLDSRKATPYENYRLKMEGTGPGIAVDGDPQEISETMELGPGLNLSDASRRERTVLLLDRAVARLKPSTSVR